MKIGLIQLTSKLEPEHNLNVIRGFMEEAKMAKVEAVFLPECFYSLSDGINATPYLIEQGNEHYKNIQALAKDYGLYLLGGSAATKKENKIINRNYNFAPDGTELQHYDKMNLFAIDLSKHPGKRSIDEAHIYTAGNTPQTLEIDPFKIGLSICFDLRFPEIFREYSKGGCNVLSICASFAYFTGQVHWHTLLKARAVENQCYVVAAAQWGQNNDKVRTYGHSLVIDPWGEILVDAGEGEKLVVADLDKKRVEDIRGRMKVF